MGKGKGQFGSNGGGGNAGSAANLNALRERFIGLSLNMVGQKVTVNQTNGAVFEGIFHTFSPFASLPAATKNKFVIKACRVIKPPQTEDAADSSQVVDQSTVIISAEKVASLTVKSMRIDTLAPGPNGSSQQKNIDGFRTDTEISGGKGGRSRDLVAADSAWTTGGGSRADALLGPLDDKDKGSRRKPFPQNNNSGLRGTIGEWDQFRANQELFNVNATFDENLYTTELDKSQIDNKKIAEAERLAREIENTASTNVHIAEERGQILEGDYDEEDRYSGVLKDAEKAGSPASKTNVGKREKAKSDTQKTSSAAPKKMNYAAAAAKADPAKKGGPPGFASASKDEKGDEMKKEETPKDKPSEGEEEKDDSTANATSSEAQEQQDSEVIKQAPQSKEEEKAEESKSVVADPEKSDVGEKETAESKPGDSKAPEEKKAEGDSGSKSSSKSGSKLNANAKEFTLNPTAKTFTPGGTGGAPTATAPESHFVDPNAAMHLQQHMPAPHYMHGPPPMNQHGMMPMMNPQFPGVRYPQGTYGGMDQHMPPMQPQPQHVNSGHGSGAPSPGPASVDENTSQPPPEGDAGAPAAPTASVPPQPQQPGHPPQQQQPQVQYGVPPPGPYYPGGMGMHPRGPGGPHPGYHPQFVGGPQPMVGPGGAPYRHMYPMQPNGGMAPNVQVRGPGAPYYGNPVAPVPYPPNAYVGHGMEGDDAGFRGGGRGRGGRGGGRRARGRSGRGGRGYNSYHQHGGRHSGQNQGGPNEAWSGDGAAPPGDTAGALGPSGGNQPGKQGEKGKP